MVVSAVGPHGKKFIPNARQDYIVVTDMTKQSGAIGESLLRDAEREIGRTGLRTIGHSKFCQECRRVALSWIDVLEQPRLLPIPTRGREHLATNVFSGCEARDLRL